MEVENEEIIRRFLLGKMSQEERTELEERFVAEGDLFEQIIGVEDELIEKYVRGWMGPDESSEFEAVFAVTRIRRERIELARTFIDQLAGDASVRKVVGQTATKSNFFAAIRQWFSFPRVAMAGAMVLLVAVAFVWIFPGIFTPNQPEVAFQPDTGTQGNPASPKPTEPIPSVLPANTTETPEPIANVETEPVSTPTKTPSPTPAKVQPVRNPVLALFSGNLRSGGSNNVLKLSDETKAVTFLLNLPKVEHNTYAAIVMDADGDTVAQFNNLSVTKGRVRIVLNASQLNKGDYMIDLKGSNGSSESESVADFQFRIIR